MKIAIEAYFDCNYGDDKMVCELLEILKGHEITLVNLKNNQDKLLFSPFLHVISDFKVQTKFKFMQMLNEYDAIFKVGGSLFQYPGYDSSLIGRYRYYKKKHELKQLKKVQIPYFVIGCNISEIRNKKTKKLYQYELNIMESISFRDSKSSALTQGITSKPMISTHSDILFTDSNKEIAFHEKGNCLGISIYNNQKYPDENQKFVNKTAELINHYLSVNEGYVNLYCFDVYTENDMVCGLAILSAISDSSRVHLVPYELDIEKFEKKLAEATIMLTVRFHSMIWALNHGIPCVPISYSMKTDHYLTDVKKEHKLISLEGYYSLSNEDLYQRLINAKPLMNKEEITSARKSAKQHFIFNEKYFK